MTRYERMTKNGYKVITVMNTVKGQLGHVHAVKGTKRIRATSETDAHRKIFGY